MSARVERDPAADTDSELADYFQDLFFSLRRSDQRRWAEVYLSGLLDGAGRRTIRHILGEDGDDRVRQSLQQFVSQSPWDPLPVRQATAARVSTVLRPMAWTFEELPFIKHGRHSAAVDRQYSRSLGRVANCQLGLAASLVDETAAVPVAWRLMLPPSWERDSLRRRRAHVPAEEWHRPYWQHLLELVDELCESWPVQPAPVVTTAHRAAEAEALLGALDDRRIPYVVEVHGDMRALPDAGHRRPGLPAAMAPPEQVPRPVPLTVLLRSREDRRQTVTWRDPCSGRIGRAQFVVTPVRSGAADDPMVGRRRVRRLLVADWPLGRLEPRTCWLTNMLDQRLPDLAALARTGARSRQALDEMGHEVGLFDFEGRSFVGWHHHVTLAAAAYAFQVVRQRSSAEAQFRGAGQSAPPHPYWE